VSPSDRVATVGHKVERAEKHVLDLQDALQAFLDSRPYEVVREYNPDTGEFSYRVARVMPTRPGIMLIAGDAIHNLRSALDHLIWQLVKANGQEPGRANEYPIFECPERYEAEKGRKIQGVGDIAANAIDATQPYKGGNDEFWILKELDNIDKHRELIGTGWAFKNVNLPPPAIRAFSGGYEFTSAPGVLQPTTPPHCLKAGDVLHSTNIDLEYDVDFGLTVAFDEPSVLQGEAVLETVKKLAHLVRNIVNCFAALL
jgi:hypothetical protein